MRLYVATSNPGKLRDFAYAAGSSSDINLEPLPDIATIPAPEETATTFVGNALIKALAYAAHAPGEIVIADDSGIVLPALNGAPGVRSARFAEDQSWPHPGQTDARNNAALLAAAENLQDRDRAAAYACVLAAVRDGELLATGRGRVEGRLLREPRGVGGFGYDPLFYLPGEGVTFAEIDPEARLRLSHRGRALVDLLNNLRR